MRPCHAHTLPIPHIAQDCFSFSRDTNRVTGRHSIFWSAWQVNWPVCVSWAGWRQMCLHIHLPDATVCGWKQQQHWLGTQGARRVSPSRGNMELWQICCKWHQTVHIANPAWAYLILYEKHSTPNTCCDKLSVKRQSLNAKQHPLKYSTII